jgi:hypothetical protein
MWYHGIYKSLIFTSAIVFTIGLSAGGDIALGSYITGYVLLTLSILLVSIDITKRELDEKSDTGAGIFKIMLSMFMNLGPFLLMLAVVLFMMSMLIKYKSNISEGRVTSGYYSFSNIIILLLITQLYIVYSNMKSTTSEPPKITKVTSSVLYLLGVLMMICSTIIYTILTYYTTDGFLSKQLSPASLY